MTNTSQKKGRTRLSLPDLDIRFWDRVEVDVASGCWLWRGSINPKGYGSYYAYDLPTRPGKAHRYSYERYRAPIAAGLTLDHLCRTRNCVNHPWHLEPVTNRVNLLRGMSPSALAAQATHCPKGHPYDEVNTHVYKRKDGATQRDCRSCNREAVLKYRAKVRARRLP